MTKKKVLKIHIILGGILVVVIAGLLLIGDAFWSSEKRAINTVEKSFFAANFSSVEWLYVVCIIVGCLLLLLVVIFSIHYNRRVVKYETDIQNKYKEINMVSKAISNLNPEFLKRAVLTFKNIHESLEDQDSKELWTLINELLKQKEVLVQDRRELYSNCSIIIRPADCVPKKNNKEIFILRKKFSQTYNEVYGEIMEYLERMEGFFCRYDHMLKCKNLLKDKQKKGAEEEEINELIRFIKSEEEELQIHYQEAREAKSRWKMLCGEKMERLSDYAFMYNYEREKKIHELIHTSINEDNKKRRKKKMSL